MTDFPDWQAPQAHANAISLTGAPPLVLKKVVDLGVGQSLPATGSILRPASGAFSINQPGYEMFFNVASLGSPAPIVSVELQWFDSFTNALMEDETYWFYSGNASGHLIHGRGPSKADQLVILMTNHDATHGVTISWTLLQVSRVFTREFWHTNTKNQQNPVFLGFTAATHDISSDVVASLSTSVPASTIDTFVLPLYTGTVRLYGQGGPAAGNIQWSVFNATDLGGSAANVVQGVSGQAGFAPFGPSSLYVPEVALPRSQCQLNINNTTTVAAVVAASMIAQEDRA